ncbi:MAG: T9SS type A sorting domain-containing protein [Saprospiraceae bacterium]|nr:T9SS type A sorting domain-containing protein [Saprospiraceae bacterium]
MDITIPASSAANDGPLTCDKLSVALTGTSNVPNAIFTWDGPCLDGTTATCPGIYTVKVTNPANWCVSLASTIVEQNITPPTVLAQDVLITCNTPEPALQATWTPANSDVKWTGPCLIQGNPNLAACTGQYNVVVTRLDNGCTASDVAIVMEDIAVPVVNLPPAPPLTCSEPCFDFVAPNLPGLEIFIGGILVPPGTTFEICAPGTYTATVRSLGNGCSSDVSLVVDQDIAPPSVDAGPDAQISCGAPSVTLNGSGSGPLLWTGPDGFTSASANPVVSQVGAYLLTATNTNNGCTATDAVQVTSDGSLPVVNASASGELNCANQSVVLQSGNTDPNASFAWTGPNGFTSNLPFLNVTVPGPYQVVVTIGVCTSTDVVEVVQAPPFVVMPSVTQVACDVVALACVDVQGGTPPYSIEWSNGNNQPCAQIGASGTVGVTVTDAGGCSYTGNQTIVIPEAMNITFSGLLNCTGLENICAMVTGGTPPYAYQWSNGTNAGCTSFPGGGLISLTVTDAAGCTKTATATVVQTPAIALTFTIEDASAANAQDGSVDLSVNGGNGNFTYQWSNGAVTQDLNNVPAGTYTVTVVDVISGCTSTGIAVVNVTIGTDEAQWLSQFQLSPNPTEGVAQLVLQLHKPSEVLVEVHSLTGQLIWASPRLEGDMLYQTIDLSNYPAGLYTVSVRLADQVFVRKLSVIR